MRQLQDEIANFTDDQLLDLVRFHKDEYTSEAMALMENEIKRRGLDAARPSFTNDNNEGPVALEFDSKDFGRFDHVFSRMDIELAAAILRDNRIIFYVDNPDSSETIPLESITERKFTIHVHNSCMEAAHALLDEHFDKVDGKYKLKEMGVRERLKAFSFHDISLSEKDAAESVRVSLTPQEKEVIIHYGKRVLDEIDRIEGERVADDEKGEPIFRAVFYFDNIEPLIEHLSERDEFLLTKTDLLTILEILQIFCDDGDFPIFMEASIATLLQFFQS